MISKKTVFVLGAGASRPYGFPTGDELRLQICAMPSGGGAMDRLLELGHGKERFLNLANTLATSALPSIDAFLARRADLESAGKTAIAAFLLTLEIEGRLQRVDDIFGRLDWYGELWAQMTDGIHDLTELTAGNQVSFVTFNYNRSLERFLHDAIKSTFRVDSDEATEALRRFPIRHVYGSLGTFDPGRHHSYGWPRTHDAAEDVLEKAVSSIRVVPIDREDEGRVPNEVFDEAERVLILGFGFDSVNCHRLGLADVVAQRMSAAPGSLKPKIFGTTLGMTDAQVEHGMRHLLGKHHSVEAGLNLWKGTCLNSLKFWNVLR